MNVSDAAGLSDRGRVRSVNEDSLLLLPEHNLFAVADGMGGHGAGDVASQLSVAILKSHYSEQASQPQEPAFRQQETQYQVLEASIDAVNAGVYAENRKNGHADGTGMGTTLTGFCLLGDGTTVITFNIGDSRLYRYRAGELTQISRDHTLYQTWLESGADSPAPPKNILQRALGLFPEVSADYTVQKIASDDLLLLCSDGLTGMLDDEQLAAMLQQMCEEPSKKICQALIGAANDHGGTDNISVIATRLGTEAMLTVEDPEPDYSDDEVATIPRFINDDPTAPRLRSHKR